MTEPRDRRGALAALCWVAFAAALVPNTVEAFTSPAGLWWDVLRWLLSAAFGAALLALVVDRALEWRAARRLEGGR